MTVYRRVNQAPRQDTQECRNWQGDAALSDAAWPHARPFPDRGGAGIRDWCVRVPLHQRQPPSAAAGDVLWRNGKVSRTALLPYASHALPRLHAAREGLSDGADQRHVCVGTVTRGLRHRGVRTDSDISAVPDVRTRPLRAPVDETLFILSEWSGDRGNINLFAVDQINIPLIPGRAQFPLPPETVEILDVYLRYFTPNGPVFTIGNTLTPLGPAGNPLVSQPFGDPLLIGPSSGVLSCTAGSQLMTMNWPSHGLYAGQPFFWGCTTSIGGIILPAFGIVNTVLDGDTFQFLLADCGFGVSRPSTRERPSLLDVRLARPMLT